MQHTLLRRLDSALEDLDCAFERAQLAVGEALELAAQRRAAGDALVELLAALLREAERETAPVVRVLRAFDQAGADQGIDRAADRRCAAAEALGDIVESRRLACRDARQQLAPGALGALGGAFADPIVHDRGKPRRERLRCRPPDHACRLANVRMSATL